MSVRASFGAASAAGAPPKPAPDLARQLLCGRATELQGRSDYDFFAPAARSCHGGAQQRHDDDPGYHNSCSMVVRRPIIRGVPRPLESIHTFFIAAIRCMRIDL